MEEGEETPPATSHSPDPSSPLQTTRVTETKPDPPLSPPSSPPDALALMPLAQAAASSGGGNSSNGRTGGGGGGREDCWSEAATAVLIDAWGERFLELSRGNLKQKHWKEVAEIVSKEGSGKSPKTDLQCKNRIDTVKKKYKQEKARIAACGGSSKWVFFEKLDRLIGATTNLPSSVGSTQKVPMGIPRNSRSNLYPRQAKATPPQQQGIVRRCSESTRWHFRKRSTSETESESESEPELSGESGDSLPPPPRVLPPAKRVKLDKTGGGGGREMGEFAVAIMRLTEAYEKAETAKLKQMAEMEKERMKFLKELELQRMEFLKTQLELSQHKQEESMKERESERRIKRTDNDIINGGKSNGNVSS